MEYLALVAEIEELKRVNEELRHEIETLRDGKQKKKPKVEKIRCPNVTAKGVQCSKYCMEGGHTCKVHSRPAKPPKQPKPPRVKKQVCTSLNMRGNPCKRKCIDGQTFCERHDPNLPVVQKKVKRNVKKSVPVHNHSPGQVRDKPCMLCDTHGDMFSSGLVGDITEVSGSDGMTLRSRLKKIAA